MCKYNFLPKMQTAHAYVIYYWLHWWCEAVVSKVFLKAIFFIQSSYVDLGLYIIVDRLPDFHVLVLKTFKFGYSTIV